MRCILALVEAPCATGCISTQVGRALVAFQGHRWKSLLSSSTALALDAEEVSDQQTGSPPCCRHNASLTSTSSRSKVGHDTLRVGHALLPLTAQHWFSATSRQRQRHLTTSSHTSFALPQPLQEPPQQPDASSTSPASSSPSSGSLPDRPGSAPDAPSLLPLPTADVVYEGPLAQQHKLLKIISLTNTAVALGAAPFIMELAPVSYVSRVGLAASLAFFGLITTGALHWVAHPYIHRLHYAADTQTLTATTSSLIGTKRQHVFSLADVTPLPWDRPVATFMARGRWYYIDVYSFPHVGLLQRLCPDEATVPKGYKEDEDDD